MVAGSWSHKSQDAAQSPVRLNDIDLRIISILREDGRTPYREVARRMGDVTERIVRYHVGRLERAGVMRVHAVLNPTAVGYKVAADVYVEVEPGCQTTIGEHLARLDAVGYVAGSTNDRELSTRVYARDTEHLLGFVDEVISKVPGVVATKTVLIPWFAKARGEDSGRPHSGARGSVRLDDVDREIISILMEDGRTPYRDVARQMGHVSERTVRYRFGCLTRSGIMRVHAVVDPAAVGQKVKADVVLEVAPGSQRTVAEHLAQLDAVTYVAGSTDDRELSTSVYASDTEHLLQFVGDVMARVPGVVGTEVVLVPWILKDIYQWRLPVEIPSLRGRSRHSQSTPEQSS